ncbi:MAG: dihydropteroate synthase [Sulfobacillus sp.]
MVNQRRFHFNGKSWLLGQKTYIMGILNVTPDSFSDGGQYNDLGQALMQAEHLIESGADMIDIGGESTRPGHTPVAMEEEWARLAPVIRELKHRWPEMPISIDTQKAGIAARAVAEGADVINDIQGGMADPQMMATVAASQAGYILMYNRSSAFAPGKVDVEEMATTLRSQVARAQSANLVSDRILVDPGLGFAYGVEDNWTVLQNMGKFAGIGSGLLLGPSRKRFLGVVTGRSEKDRDWATAGVASIAVGFGMDVVRVHDVLGVRQAVLAADRWWRHD